MSASTLSVIPPGVAPKGRRVIGAVDIGGTKIAVAGVREDGTVLCRHECPTEPERGFDRGIQVIGDMLRQVASYCSGMDGIGIASPGPLDPITGILDEVGTLPGWKGGNLCVALGALFGVPVAVENDADAAALGEFAWGSGNGASNFIYLTVSTGIGGGIVHQGHLYRGVEGAHPELGHQILDPSGPLCYCSAHGCWESLASGSALSAWMHEQAPDRPFFTAAEICDLARAGDPLARRGVERVGFYLGLGLANIITLFSPQSIALGGGVMKSSELFMEHALKTMYGVCTQVPAEKTKISLASLGENAGLLGAAQSWITRYGT